MATACNHILLFGPPFSGKTYLAERLAALGLNAVDGDSLIGLSCWKDRSGRVVEPPEGFGRDFLCGHSFVWDREFLARFVDSQPTLILCGHSMNVDECFDLFDAVYFLDLPDEELERRLVDNERENSFGRTEEQKEMVRGGRRVVRGLARDWGVPALDASQSPESVAADLLRLMGSAESDAERAAGLRALRLVS